MTFQLTLPSKPTPLAALDILDTIRQAYTDEETHTRIPELVEIIASDPRSAYCYACSILNGRFELGEPAIATDAETSYEYADFINGRFELGEPAIATGASYSYWYASEVIKGRFELGEPAIQLNPKYKTKYTDFINSLD
jgi:hypothetical protein